MCKLETELLDKLEEIKQNQDEFMKNCLSYGLYFNMDIEKNIAKWLLMNQGKVIKSSENADVYLIRGEQKLPFPDLATFYGWGFLDEDIVVDTGKNLDDIKTGEPLNFWDGDHIKIIKAVIMKRKELKYTFQTYFNDLWNE